MKMAFDPQIICPRIPSGKEGNNNDKKSEGLKQLCQDFEAIFINTLFQEMRKTVPDDGFLESDSSSDLFQEMMDMEVAREMSRKGSLGLGKVLYEQLSRDLDFK